MPKHKQKTLSIKHLFIVYIFASVGIAELFMFFLLKNQLLLRRAPEDEIVPPLELQAFEPLENPELYVDKEKGISFVYPKNTHKVTTDSEAEYNKISNSGIPESFMKLKGYEPPKLLWALKVEETKPFYGRYSEEAPATPFSVWVFDNPEKIRIQDWFEKYWYYPFIWGDAVQSEIERMKPTLYTKINGQQSYSFDAGPSPRGYRKEMYIQQGNKIYLFELTGDQEASIEDQIAESFTFLMSETSE